MPIRPFPVREYESIKVTENGGPGSLSTREADALVDLRAEFGCKNSREWFRYVRGDTIKAGGWVGVITVGEAQITVSPKIEGQSSQVDLVKVLVGSGWLDETFWGSSLIEDGSTLLSLFANLYAKRLSTEIGRGLPRRYVAHSENLATLRGGLNLDRQIALMATGSPRLACDHDVFETDTPLNQALKAGLARALALVDDNSLRPRLRALLHSLDDVSDKAIQPHDVDRIVLSRGESRLRPLLSLARLFLMSKAPQIRGSATGVRSFGLMFSMWKLFEEYALAQLNKSLEAVSAGTTRYFAKGQEKQRYLARYQAASGGMEDAFQIKPDIIIYREAQGIITPVMIADTKWKDIEEDSEKKTLGVSQSDAYQLFSYSNLYTKRGDPPLPLALIYPKVGNLNGDLPRTHNSDQPLGVLGSPRRTFHLDCESDDELDGVKLDIFDFPLPCQA